MCKECTVASFSFFWHLWYVCNFWSLCHVYARSADPTYVLCTCRRPQSQYYAGSANIYDVLCTCRPPNLRTVHVPPTQLRTVHVPPTPPTYCARAADPTYSLRFRRRPQSHYVCIVCNVLLYMKCMYCRQCRSYR